MVQGPRVEYAQAYELAYVEGVRALSEQQGVIDNFRTRAGVLLSGAAIATSFLGGAALERGADAWSWIAIVLFVLVGLAIGAVLWPRDDWEYTVRPEALISEYVEAADPLPVPLIHRDLALHMDASYLRNRGQLLRLVRYFRLAGLALMLEILCWVGDLISQA